jgi:hypothetical protein
MAHGPHEQDARAAKQRDMRPREVAKDLDCRLALRTRPKMALALREDPLDAVEVVAPFVLKYHNADNRVHRLVIKEKTPNTRQEVIRDSRPRDLPDLVKVNNRRGKKFLESLPSVQRNRRIRPRESGGATTEHGGVADQ